MEIDPLQTVESIEEANEGKADAPRHRWLNPAVAITVAVLATFMGICQVKAGNVGQAMQQAQADKLDHWQFYQARNIREEVAKATLAQLRLQAAAAAPAMKSAYAEQIKVYEDLAASQNQKKEALKTQAEQDQLTYDALNMQDDQFDLSDALIAIAISLLAVASLTQFVWLYALALVPSVCGVIMGMAGLAGWGIHPTFFTSLLS